MDTVVLIPLRLDRCYFSGLYSFLGSLVHSLLWANFLFCVRSLSFGLTGRAKRMPWSLIMSYALFTHSFELFITHLLVVIGSRDDFFVRTLSYIRVLGVIELIEFNHSGLFGVVG